MARYTGPACKLCRRDGNKLFLKGDRCLTDKCALSRRNKAPGPHGTQNKKMKEYGMQLREKQKAKRIYGVPEKQFRTYFDKADRLEGQTGENLLSLLECRLDNVVFKMGMAENRHDARQLVLHGHFTLNGKKVTIPSIIVKPGDTIELKDSSRSSVKFKELVEKLDGVTAPKWIDLDKANVKATITAKPARDDVDFPFEEHLIVELYSK
ncbi:MAG: 30S ribosomal protein S4 [Clostridia bacterium]|nr:30S ribosomal protein S4 [Clostridia bacterium]